MRDSARYHESDLVLEVSSNVDPDLLDLTVAEPFLSSLCHNRDFQKKATRTTLRYLFGGIYSHTAELARKNYASNSVLRDKYPTEKAFLSTLPLGGILSCSIDMATGTGKSYVIYAIARIALALRLVERVLVLCPSNTIEDGLKKKFRKLSQDDALGRLVPEGPGFANPEIVDATETAVEGSICVENIHATYSTTRSSITESYGGRGAQTLVLSDEAHHIYTPGRSRDLKKWLEFIRDPEFNFAYHVGLSGTCYVGNEYFPDVVSRYSLRQAMEDGVVKDVRYVVEDVPGDEYEYWQKIYANHRRNVQKYSKTKPLTIIVTKDRRSCASVTKSLITYLQEEEDLSEERAAEKVMRVHTPRSSVKGDRQIEQNIAKLLNGTPDRIDDLTEWITSVSMLTEGWDVQNVFQIVPHQERAFDSKLLIAQVLGRGLRVPLEYRGERPVVTVYNHHAWSGRIQRLVDEVLEHELRIFSQSVEKGRYGYELDNIDYAKAEEVVKTPQEREYNFDMEVVNLASQAHTIERTTEYEEALEHDRERVRTEVRVRLFPIEKVVNDVYKKFKAIDFETGSTYSKRYPKDAIRALVHRSLEAVGYEGEHLTKENRQRILSSFGNLYRPGSKSLRYRMKPKQVTTVTEVDRPRDSVGFASLRRDKTVFYDDLTKQLDEESGLALSQLEKDESRPVWALEKIDNSFLFKTALSTVITSGGPERTFVRHLVESENAQALHCWMKNTDTGYYSLEYSYRRGDFSDRGEFNPDFFLFINEQVVVVEIKDDEEIRSLPAETRGKRKAAVEHFDLLNSLLEEKRYHITFLTPRDFDHFFQALREKKAHQFRSNLDAGLSG